MPWRQAQRRGNPFTAVLFGSPRMLRRRRADVEGKWGAVLIFGVFVFWRVFFSEIGISEGNRKQEFADGSEKDGGGAKLERRSG